MKEPIKLVSLQAENVKRIKAVLIDFKRPLTIIGGRNGQGKTSVLDVIAWAIGGDRFKPSNACRDGSMCPPEVKVALSNGWILERSGAKGRLKITVPGGEKQNQGGINDFIHPFALDLPKFLNSTAKEKANQLLTIIGVGDALKALDNAENQAYEARHAYGQIKDQKVKYAAEMPFFADAPEQPVSAVECIQRQQAIILKNAENQKLRENVDKVKRKNEDANTRIDVLNKEIADKIEQRNRAEQALSTSNLALETALKSAADLQDESTAEIESSLLNIEETNVKVRSNLDKQKALDDAEECEAEYAAQSTKLEKIRAEKIALLDNAYLPHPGLSVEDGELTYNGHKWDCMASSDQLIVATSIVQKLNPDCGFVLLDKLEQLDVDTLTEFGEYLEKEGLQGIATRVSTGDECTVIIEDGCNQDAITTPNKPINKPSF